MFWHRHVVTLLFLLAAIPLSAVAAQRGVLVELKEREDKTAKVVERVRLYPNSYALVIGNDDYRDPFWARLSNGIRDAREVAAALEAKGFEVTLRTNLDGDDLEDALEGFFIDKGGDPEARLFVWYAGHGHTERGEGYLVPVDAPDPDDTRQFRRRALSLRRIGEYARDADAHHVLAVFDSCFAGTVFEVQRTAPPAAITRATTRPVRQFITSGDAGQAVSDDGTFRKMFIEAIGGERRADLNGDGFVTASELGLFLNDSITNYSHGQQTPRHGKLRDPDWDQGDFVFVLPAREPAPVQHPATARPAAPSGIDPYELAFWDAIKNSTRAEDYAAYLEQYPAGRFAPLARLRAGRVATPSDVREQSTAQSAGRAPPAPEAQSEQPEKLALVAPPAAARLSELEMQRNGREIGQFLDMLASDPSQPFYLPVLHSQVDTLVRDGNARNVIRDLAFGHEQGGRVRIGDVEVALARQSHDSLGVSLVVSNAVDALSATGDVDCRAWIDEQHWRGSWSRQLRAFLALDIALSGLRTFCAGGESVQIEELTLGSAFRDGGKTWSGPVIVELQGLSFSGFGPPVDGWKVGKARLKLDYRELDLVLRAFLAEANNPSYWPAQLPFLAVPFDLLGLAQTTNVLSMLSGLDVELEVEDVSIDAEDDYAAAGDLKLLIQADLSAKDTLDLHVVAEQSGSQRFEQNVRLPNIALDVGIAKIPVGLLHGPELDELNHNGPGALLAAAGGIRVNALSAQGPVGEFKGSGAFRSTGNKRRPLDGDLRFSSTDPEPFLMAMFPNLLVREPEYAGPAMTHVLRMLGQRSEEGRTVRQDFDVRLPSDGDPVINGRDAGELGYYFEWYIDVRHDPAAHFPGLEVSKLVIQPERSGGHKAFIVSGEVANAGETNQVVPPIRITVMDNERRDLGGLVVRTDRSLLKPGQSTPFIARATNLPDNAEDVWVALIEPE